MGQPAAAQGVARPAEVDAVRLALGPSLQNLLTDGVVDVCPPD